MYKIAGQLEQIHKEQIGISNYPLQLESKIIHIFWRGLHYQIILHACRLYGQTIDLTSHRYQSANQFAAVRSESDQHATEIKKARVCIHILSEGDLLYCTSASNELYLNSTVAQIFNCTASFIM